MTNTFHQEIHSVLTTVEQTLLEKNERYGDSALNPKRVFSKADSIEQIKVRIDDKLSRIANNTDGDTEDVVIDLIGYLVLLRIAQNRKFKKTCNSTGHLL